MGMEAARSLQAAKLKYGAWLEFPAPGNYDSPTYIRYELEKSRKEKKNRAKRSVTAVSSASPTEQRFV